MFLDKVKLYKAMKEAGLRQKDLPELCGLSIGTVSAVCNGRNCKYEIAEKISAAVGVSVKDIASDRLY